MNAFKRVGLLASVGLATALYVSAAGNAVAAPGRIQAVPVGPSLTENSAVAVDYVYNHKHYHYKYGGKYYNHRRHDKDGKWHYY